tara:strand:- start:207 stop:1487 length:1281 start_codon:yes stop_codon:yes gene_type:complete
MSVTQTRNVDYVLVGKAVNTASISTINDLADGEIGTFKIDGSTGVAEGDKFIIALGGPNSKPKFVSEPIDPVKAEAGKSRGLEVATEQITNIGYNGTGGSIQGLAIKGYYRVDLYIQEYLTSSTDGRYIKHGQWNAGAVAPTQIEVADGVALSLYLNFKREAENYVDFSVLSAAATVATAGTVNVVNGSTAVALSVAGDVAANGDYIRLGNTTSSPMYKVIAGAGTTAVTVDRPIIEATQQFAIAAADSITKAAAIAAAAGIKIIGKPLSFVVGKENYRKVRWTTLTNVDFEGTEIANSANAFEGIGTYEQAAEAEWFARGAEGEYFRMGEPSIYTSVFNADPALTYDVCTIRWVEDSVVGFQPNVSPKQITLYTPNTAGYMAVAKATGNAGVTLSINTAFDGITSKLSHRDTGATSDTPNRIDLH